MKRKIVSTLFALVLVLTLGLVTAVPAAAADREILNQTRLAALGSATVEWDTGTVYAGDYSAHGIVPSNADFFNVVHMDIGDGTPITLGEITSIQFMEYMVTAGGASDLSAAVILFLNDPLTDPPVEGVASWWDGFDDGITFHNNGESAPVGEWSVRDLSDVAQNWEGYADSVGTGTVEPLSYWTAHEDFADWEVVFVSVAVGDGEWAGYEGYIDNVMVEWSGGVDTYLTEPRIVNTNQEMGYNYIQDAIDDATASDTIAVAAGTYAECLNVNRGVSIVGAGVSEVTINVSGLAGYDNAGIYVSADNVLLQGFTQVGNPAASLPRYGIKFADVSGGSVMEVLARDNYRTGFDFLGTMSTTVSDVESRDNGGHGIQLCDSTDVALSNITVSGNAWQGVSVATWGHYTTLGTSGIVFDGTNSFVDVFQLEEGDYNNPGFAPAGEAIITYSTNPADVADVTVQASDFGYALHGDQDDGSDQNRVWFFKTLAEAQAVALAPLGHFDGIGVYVESLTDRTQLYVSPGCEVQAAIDSANPAGGDTISVAAGIYTEQVNIEVSLTITGAGQATTHIVAPDPVTMTIYDLFGSKGADQRYIVHRGTNIPVVRIAASDVTFEGFHVDLGDQVFFDVLGTGSDPTYSKGVGILVDHVETVPETPDAFTGVVIQNNMVDGLLWDDYSDCIKVMAQATVNINHNTLYGYGESAVAAQGMDTPRAAFYSTVTANDNTMYGGSDVREGNHYFFGVGYWSGATGSADGNTIYNAPNGNGYALNSWTPNPVSFTNNIILTDGGAVGGYGAQLYESSNLVFSGNDVQNQGLAGAIWKGGGTGTTITVTNNEITNCIDGFIGDELSTGSVTLHYNNFSGIADGHYALDMVGHGVSIWGSAVPCTITADATNNWWGSEDGPEHAGNTFNVSSQGDKVSDDVDYVPWLDAPYDTGLSFAPVENTATLQQFSSIQAAIDSDIEPEETISVEAGTYDEQVVIDKPLTLRGPNAGISPNTGSRVAEAVITGVSPLVRLPTEADVNPLTIEGFTFQDATDSGVTRQGVILANGISDGWGNVTIRSNRFINNYGPAVAVWAKGSVNSAGWTITGNLIDGVTGTDRSGIYLDMDLDPYTLTGWEISNNTIKHTQYGGIMVDDAVDMVISGNTIEDVQKTGIQPSGVSQNLTIRDNVITRAMLAQAEPFRAGIRLYGIDPNDPYEAGTLIGPVWVTNNIVTDSYIGFAIKDGHDITDMVVHVNGNNFTGNSEADLRHGGTGLLDATNNWWGNAIESQIAELVSGNVDYSPWLDAAYPDGNSTSLDVTTISLASGWNLISLPIIPVPDDSAIETVLAGVTVNKVAYYTGGPEGNWLYYSEITGISDLTQMQDGKGYWIDVSTAGALTIRGYELCAPPPAVPPSYSLVEGWNLISFKSLATDTDAATYLGTAVTDTIEAMYGYDAAAGLYRIIKSTDTLVPGNGYWLAVSAEGTIYP